MPNPPYTKEARAARFEGIVLVEGVITLDGKITRMKLIKGAGNGLDDIALKTLKTWKCKPATGLEGKPVPTIVTFQVNFELGSH
jgi:protein TonB